MDIMLPDTFTLNRLQNRAEPVAFALPDQIGGGEPIQQEAIYNNPNYPVLPSSYAGVDMIAESIEKLSDTNGTEILQTSQMFDDDDDNVKVGKTLEAIRDQMQAAAQVQPSNKNAENIHFWQKMAFINPAKWGGVSAAMIDRMQNEERREDEAAMFNARTSNEMNIRQVDYKQADLDNARALFDRAEQQYKTLNGNINSATERANEYLAAGLQVPQELQTHINSMREQQDYWAETASLFKDYIQEKGSGRKPSNSIFAAQKQTEGGEPIEPQTPEDTFKQSELITTDYLKDFKDYAVPKDLTGLRESLGIAPEYYSAFEKRMRAAAEANSDRELKRLDIARRSNDLTEQQYRTEKSRIDAANAKITEDMNAGELQAIKDFLAGDTNWNRQNAAYLASLVKNYNASNPKNAFEIISEIVMQKDRSEYEAQLAKVKAAFGGGSKRKEAPPAKEKKDLPKPPKF